TVQIERSGYKESIRIPKASEQVVDQVVRAAVEEGYLWLLSGPASILAEPIPPGILTTESKLCAPPEPFVAAEILPENLPGAWTDGNCSGLSIATCLSMKVGKTLPWKTVK